MWLSVGISLWAYVCAVKWRSWGSLALTWEQPGWACTMVCSNCWNCLVSSEQNGEGSPSLPTWMDCWEPSSCCPVSWRVPSTWICSEVEMPHITEVYFEGSTVLVMLYLPFETEKNVMRGWFREADDWKFSVSSVTAPLSVWQTLFFIRRTQLMAPHRSESS